ncbi:pancreatic lipase-related protein 2-like [Arctopsyche grandis]|uniref:pancreatic lipase-related protein 2-like n=1 Tax=Arctopsyche grandis TaxID=121162 RepID=UPI00406D8F47
MKLLILTLFAVSACAVVSAGTVIPDFLKYKEGQKYFFTTDENGKLIFVDLEAKDVEHRFNAESDVVFRLYTRKNPTNANVITYGNVNSLTSSNFDKSKPVKIISHGWNNNGGSEVNTLITERFLAALDVNVICVDWGKGASALYNTAVGYVPGVGTFIAKLVDWLVNQGANVNNFHLMGHSLGGHITGIAARSVTKGKIPYITAFDPAFPLWGSGSQRIRPSDANYVEIIHSNGGNLGLEEPVGHNDFYPNGGKSQPGCGALDVGCSHGRSYQFFAYSLNNQGFMANQCRSVTEINNNSCANLSKLHMGGASPKSKVGLFRLETNSNPPYYKG